MYNDGEFELDENSMDELISKSIEFSMRYVYDIIEKIGMEEWVKQVPLPKERKLGIIDTMIKWYEEREEFESCAFLLKGKKQLENC